MYVTISIITERIIKIRIIPPLFVNFSEKIFDNFVIIGRIFSKGDGINA